MVWVDHIDERLQTSTVADRRFRAARWVSWALLTYLLLSILLVGIIRHFGERWWPATVMMFGPRWVWSIPLAVLIPAAFWASYRRINLLLLAICLWVVLKMLMGFCVPWRVWVAHFSGTEASPGGSAPFHLRVMTCNVHDRALHPDALAKLIDQTHPDVVCFEEWFDIPVSRLGHSPSGRWHMLHQGELRVQSRFPIRHGPILFDHGWGGGAAAEYILQTPAGPVPLFVLHLASPHSAISSAVRLTPIGEARMQGNSWTRGAQAGMLGELAGRAGRDVLLMGDFNMPWDSELYRQDLSGFEDAFSFAGWGFGWTYYARGTAVRIDHVLSGGAWRCDRCFVGPFVGSPHRPVIADLTLIQPPSPATRPR